DSSRRPGQESILTRAPAFRRKWLSMPRPGAIGMRADRNMIAPPPQAVHKSASRSHPIATPPAAHPPFQLQQWDADLANGVGVSDGSGTLLAHRVGVSDGSGTLWR